MKDPKALNSHFEFGNNWKSFSSTIDEKIVYEAEKSLDRLMGKSNVRDKSFLDIGSGSGLFSLAASRMGARKILAIDIDPECVATTKQMLETFATNRNWVCRKDSIFDLDPSETGSFDIVYSWGVLHHTGDLYQAIHRAAKFVAPRGLFVLGLYRKTPLCPFWKIEKQIYASKFPGFQSLASLAYKSLVFIKLISSGKNPFRYILEYSRDNRGMSWHHDIHDWLGGYPYESISPTEMNNVAQSLGMKIDRSFVRPSGLGLFGFGNDEYVLKLNP